MVSCAMNSCSHYDETFGTQSKIPTEITLRCSEHRNARCLACKRLVAIENKIQDARLALQGLLDERESLISVVNEQHDPFAHRLPVEVVSRIFKHYRPFAPSLDDFDPKYKPKTHIQQTFAITHVCRHWRNIAHETPALWTIVPISLSVPNWLLTSTPLREWLARSRCQPLFVWIRASDHDLSDEVFAQSLRKAITTVGHHSQRWNALSMEVPAAVCYWVSSVSSVGSLNRLEFLKIGADSLDGPDLQEVLSFRAVPRRLVSRTFSAHQISVDFANLTHFDASHIFYSISIPFCLNLFRNAPLLAFCSLDEVSGRPPDGPLALVSGPSLHHLDIAYFPPEFWTLFNFPSLKTLRIGHLNAEAVGWTAMQAFFNRSNCHLHDLEIYSDSSLIQASDLVETLACTPYLQSLSIRSDISTRCLFSLLDAAMVASGNQLGAPDFLCNLKSLVCASRKISSASWSWMVLFLNTMNSRQERTLRHVEIKYSCCVTDLEPLQNLLTPVGKGALKHLLVAIRGMEFRMTDTNGEDILRKLCRYYEIELPPISTG